MDKWKLWGEFCLVYGLLTVGESDLKNRVKSAGTVCFILYAL